MNPLKLHADEKSKSGLLNPILYVSLLLTASTAFALPQGEKVAAGQADFQTSDARTLQITASDKSIINYRSFDINEGEHVQFIQPSCRSSVLNRILGEDPSQVLGKLSGNGRVYLINPNGIFFGPNAVINTGSFLASTLNIRDEDFLNGKLNFFQDGSEYGKIVNEGTISASPEGFVALFAPFIKNQGSIFARAGKVVLASAEKVTLDFSGDGLLQFAVDGELKEALIENYGNIEAVNGNVEISMGTAQDAIKMVVNTDGFVPATDLKEVDGVAYLVSKSIGEGVGTIHLGSESKIAANQVLIEGEDRSIIDVHGTIDATNSQAGEKGGTVHLLGENVLLSGVNIHASGDSGGGTILIGGDYQGKGSLRTARNSLIDSDSTIISDAIRSGDGGKIIVWADHTTVFEGTILARGGQESGNGGFVETSGKNGLGIPDTAKIDISALRGDGGTWLLDPNILEISGTGSTPIPTNCTDSSNYAVSPTTIQSVTSGTVTLCAQFDPNTSYIWFRSSVAMSANTSLTCIVASAGTGYTDIKIEDGVSITATNGNLIFQGTVGCLGTSTQSTFQSTNGSVTFTNSPTGSTYGGLSADSVPVNVSAGGTVNLNFGYGYGSHVSTNTLTVTGGSIVVGGNMKTAGGAIQLNGPVTLNAGISVDTTNANASPTGANIGFSNTVNGASALTLTGGTSGGITFSNAVGGTTALTSLSATAATITQNSTVKTTGAVSYTGSTAINISGNITTTSSGAITITGPVGISGAPTLTTAGNQNITFSGTTSRINGATSLSLAAGSGTVSFGAAVGNSTPLTNLSFASAGLIQIANNITVTGANPLSFPSAVTLTGSSVITSNNANVSFSSTINGAYGLTVTAGSGTATFSGAVGGSTALTSLTVTGATITQSSTVKTTGAVSYTGSTAININGNITTANGAITMTGPVSLTATPLTFDATNGGATTTGANIYFSNTLSGTSALTLTAGTGTITFTGAVSSLTSLTATGGTINQNSTVTSTGPVTYNGAINLYNNITAGGDIYLNGAVVLKASLALSTGFNKNITFVSTVNGTTAGAENLTLSTSGTGIYGNISFNGVVGGTTRLGTITVSAANIFTANALTIAGFTQAAGTGLTTFNGAVSTTTSGISINNTNTTFNSTVQTNLNPVNVTVSGTLVLSSSAVFTQLGSFTATGTVQSAGSISTVNYPIQFNGAVALTGATVLNTDGGTNGNIQFLNALDGPGNLTMTAGSSAISFASTIGVGATTRLGALTITTANQVTASGSIKATSIAQGSTTLLIPTSTYLSIDTNAAAGVSLYGSSISINGSLITSAGGPFLINNTSTLNLIVGSSSISGPFTQQGGGAVNFSGTLATVNSNITFTNAVTLTGAAVFSSGSGSGAIAFNSTISGANTLSVSAGSGSITFSGAVGTPALTPLTSLSASGGTITQSSTVTTTGLVSYTGSAININGNITTAGSPITMTGPVLLSGSSLLFSTTNGTLNPLGANISFSSTVDSSPSFTPSLTLTSGTSGTVTFSGVVGGIRPLGALSVGPAPAGININGSITTAGGAIQMNGPVSLTTALLTISSATISVPAGAAITFSSTLDGTATVKPALTLNGGTGGAITFSGIVGGTYPLGSLSATGSAINVYGNITTAGGAIAMNSPVVLFATPLAFDTTSGAATGANISFSSTLNGATALTLKAGSSGAVSFSGAVGGLTPLTNLIFTSASQINIGANITVSGANPLTFPFPVVLTGSSTITTNTPTQSITFSSTISGNRDLIVTASSGTITFSGAIGASPLTALSSLTATGSAISIGGSIRTAGGTTGIILQGPVSLTSTPLTFDTTNSGAVTVGAPISFSSSLNGTVAITPALTLTAGAGAVTFGGAIGGTYPLASLSVTGGTITVDNNITTAGGAIAMTGPVLLAGSSLTFSTTNGTFNPSGANISFSSTVDSSPTFTPSLTLTAGTSGIISSGAIGTSHSLGALTANAYSISLGSIGTNSTAGVTGATNLTATTSLNFTGTTYNLNSYSASASVVNFQAGALTTFTANGNPILFSAPIQLSSGTNLTINSSNGAITLGTIDAVANNLRTLILNAGSADIHVGQIGTSNNAEFASVQFTFGNLYIQGNLFSNAVTFTETLTTPTKIYLSGSITTNSAITFPIPVEVDIASATVSTAASGSTNDLITFSNAITGNPASNSLMLAAGSGNIVLTGAVSNLASLTISSARNVTANALTVGALIQSAGTGTTTFNGAINTVASGTSINLVGAAFTFNNTVTTTNSGSVSILNGSTLDMESGATFHTAGGFSQSGTGAVTMANSITADGGQILFNSAVTLTGNVTLNTAVSAQTIQFNSSIDSSPSGPFNLTLVAGNTSASGNINVYGNMGLTTPHLGVVTASFAQNITIQSLYAYEAVLIGGTGTVTTNGNTIIGAGGINISANNFVATGSYLITTDGGNVILNNSGTISGSAGFTITCDGNFWQTGSGPVYANGLTTVNGNSSVPPPVSSFPTDTVLGYTGSIIVAGASTFNVSAASAAGKTVYFQNTVDGVSGAPSLTIDSRGGSVIFAQPVGAGTALGALIIDSATTFLAQSSIRALSISQTNTLGITEGTTTFTGDLSTSGTSGISIKANAITRGAAITTTGGGGLTITNDGGTFDSIAAGDITVSGAINQNGSGPVHLAGNIYTSNSNVHFASPITLYGAVWINSGTATGSITLDSTVQGAYALTLISGNNITLSGNIGTGITPLTGFTITTANVVSTQAITALFIKQSGAAATTSAVTTFNGALTTTGTSGISLTGRSFTLNQVTTTSGGPLYITNSGVVTFNSIGTYTNDISGAVTVIPTSTGSASLSSTIKAAGLIQFDEPLSVPTLMTGVLDTSAAGQAIILASTVDGPGSLTLSSQAVSLTTTTGNITILGAVGSINPLNNLTISTVHDLSAQSINTGSLTQSAANPSGSGTSTFNGAITCGSGGISLTGYHFTFLQNVTTNSTGAISINNAGTLTTTAGMTISSNGNFVQSGTGLISLAGTIQTTNTSAANANITISGQSAITLTAPVSIDSSAGFGTITIGNLSLTTNSTITGHQPITFNAGANTTTGGNIFVYDQIGQWSPTLQIPVGAVTFTSMNNLTVYAITADSITQTNGIGQSTFSGVLATTTPTGINLTGTKFYTAGSPAEIYTYNGGSFTYTNSDIATGAGGIYANITGSYIQNGAGVTGLGGYIKADQGVSFTGPLLIGSDTTFDTSVGSGNITFTTLDGYTSDFDVTLIANNGNIIIGPCGTLTSLPLGRLTFQSAHDITVSAMTVGSIATSNSTPFTGVATFNGPVTTTGTVLTTSAIPNGIVLYGNAIAFNDDVTTLNDGVVMIDNSGSLSMAGVSGGHSFSLSGAFTQSGAGSVTLGDSMTVTNTDALTDAITFASPITLSAPVALTSSAGSGDHNIVLNGVIDGATTLTVSAGTGNVTFGNTIGHTTPLTSLTIPTAGTVLCSANVSISGPFSTGTTSATGNTTFSGTLGATSISLNGAAISFNGGAVNATSGGILIANNGLLTISSLAPVTASSYFRQNGAGGVSMANSITASGFYPATTQGIYFASDITLAATSTLTTGSYDIYLNGTVSGANALAFAAGTGNITTQGMGSPTPLTSVTFTSATNISTQAISAGTITQTNGTGTTTFNGALYATASVTGINLTGSVFQFLDNVTTTTGACLVTNKSPTIPSLFGPSTGAAKTFSIARNFTQLNNGAGTGPVSLNANISTTNGSISFASAVTLNGTVALNSSANNRNIAFSGTLDGAYGLALTAGAGSITFTGAVGNTVPHLGSLTVNSANTVLHSSSVSSTGAISETATTIQLNGNMTTYGGSSTNGITLTGNVTVGASSVALSTSSGDGNIVTGAINGDIAGRNFSATTGLPTSITANGYITIGSIGSATPLNNVTLSANNISLGNLGASGTTSVTAKADIALTGTSYRNGTQTYQCGVGHFINFTNGSATTVSSNASPITFTDGTTSNGSTINLSNDLTVASNGGTISMANVLPVTTTSSPTCNYNCTVNASTGDLYFIKLGSPSLYLDTVTLTAGTTGQFHPYPDQGNNVYSCGLVVNTSETVTLFTGNYCMGQADPFNASAITKVVYIHGTVTVTCCSTFGYAWNIDFQNTIDADPLYSVDIDPNALIIQYCNGTNPCCSGSVTFEQPVGSQMALDSLSIDSACYVDVQSIMNVGTFSVTNTTSSGCGTFSGTVSVAQGLTASAAGGVTIDATAINLTGTFSSAGNFVLNNSGNINITAGSTFNITGAFDQAGAGSVSIGGTVITNNSTIDFNGPITLNGDVQFNSSTSTAGDITFGKPTNTITIEGAKNLTINSGHDIYFYAALGTPSVPLTSLDITNAHDVTVTDAIYANAVTQSNGSGTSSFKAITTNASDGVRLTGTDFTFDGNITTGGNGPLEITNAGAIIFNNHTYSIEGAFIQNGSGSTQISGIFSADSVSFAKAVELIGDTSFDTPDVNGNIVFSGAITSSAANTNSLVLSAGAGGITFGGDIGTTSIPIGDLIINTTTGAVSAGTIYAHSITEGPGTNPGAVSTSITGSMTTTGPIALNGVQFTINSSVNSGAFSITNTGNLSLALNTSNITGNFTQSGGGAVTSLSGSLTATGYNISFGNDITLTGATTLSTGSSSGSITLARVNGNYSFDLTTGGNITFNQSLGSSGPLASLTIYHVADVNYPSVSAGSISQIISTGTTTITGTLTATGPSGISITGNNITQNGNILTNYSGGGLVTFTNSGLLTIGTSSSTTASGAYTQIAGTTSATVSLGKSISATNSLITFNSPITLAANVALNAGPSGSATSGITLNDKIDGGAGPFTLTLTAPPTSGGLGGVIALNADVGSITPLAGFTITSAKNVTTEGISSAFITQTTGTGTTTFNGALSTTDVLGISLTGNAFTFANIITTTNSGPVSIINTGLLQFTYPGTTHSSIAGAFTHTQNGTGGSIQLSTYIACSGAMQFHAPFSVPATPGAGTLDTSAANQPITFYSTVNGPGSLTLSSSSSPSATTGDITISGAVGGLSALSSLTISTVHNLSVQSINAGQLIQSAASPSGTSTFNENVTCGSGGISLTGTAFTFLQNVTTTSGGSISIINDTTLTTSLGTLTTTPGKLIVSNGNFTQSGTGPISLGSSITTNNALAANANISFLGSGPISLTNDVELDSHYGNGTITVGVTDTSGTILYASTIDGNYNISLNSGTSGDIAIFGAIGSSQRVKAFTLISVKDAVIQAITAGSIVQNMGYGISGVLGSLDTDSSGGINLTGNEFFVGPLATTIHTSNGGSFIVHNTGIIYGSGTTVTTVNGMFEQTGSGLIVLGGPLYADQGISCTGPVLFGLDADLVTLYGNGNIEFHNTVDGLTGTENLTLIAGSGNISFDAAIGTGAAQPPSPPFPGTTSTFLRSLTATGGTITIADVGTLSAPGINNSTSLIASGDINFTGTTINANQQTYDLTSSPAGSFNMNAGSQTSFYSNGSTLEFTGGTAIILSTGTNLSMDTTSGTSSADLMLGNIQAQLNNRRTLTLSTGASSITMGDLGAIGQEQFGSATYTCNNLTLGDQYADTFSLNYSGTLFAGGDIFSTDTALTFQNPVILTGSDTFSTVGLSGNSITFNSTIDSYTSAIPFGLTLNAGIGSIEFKENIGVTNALSSLTIASAMNAMFDAGKTTIVYQLYQASGFGTTTFNGTVVVPTDFGITLTGNNFTFSSGSITQTLNNGSLTITNAGVLTLDGTVLLSGAFSQVPNGTASSPTVSLFGYIQAGQPILFSSPVTVPATTTTFIPILDTSAANQTITFRNTIDGPGNIILMAGGGDITILNAVGNTTRLGSVMITSSNNITVGASVKAASLSIGSPGYPGSTGLVILNGALDTNGPGGVLLVGNNFLLNGSVTTVGGNLVLTNSGYVTGYSVNNLTIGGDFIQNGTGIVTIAGTLTTQGTISYASPLVVPSSITAILDSSANNQDITISNVVNGPGNLILKSSSSPSATTGNIYLTSTSGIGSSTALGAVTITSAHNVNMTSVNAASLIQSAGSGTTTIAGNVTTDTSAGISLTGFNFSRGGNWTASAGGSITVNNSGSFTSTAAGTIHAAENFNQSGAGPVAIVGTVTSDSGSIAFTGPVTITGGDLTLASGASCITCPGILFHSGSTLIPDVNSTRNLNLSTSGGYITFSSPVGSPSLELGLITVSNAGNVTFNGLESTAFQQTAGTGTTTFNGTTDISTVSGMQITTNAIALNGTVATNNFGPMTLTNNSGLLTVAGTVQSSGDFTQNGTGSSLISGSVTTTNGSILFIKAVAVSGTASLTASNSLTTSYDITLSSTLNGPGSLTLNAGSTGNIDLIGAAGGSSRLNVLTFTNANQITTSSITAASIVQIAGTTTEIMGDLNTTSGGISLAGSVFDINGSIITTGSGPVTIDHGAASTLVFGSSTSISGPFNEIGSGTVSVQGNLNMANANITFNNMINLTGAITLASNGGTIQINTGSGVIGSQDLILSGGSGTTVGNMSIGAAINVRSLTIQNPQTASFQAITADYITQTTSSTNTVLTTFLGALNAAGSGIDLTGNQFTFAAPVTTSIAGVQISNSGLLTIQTGAPFNLAGSFSQNTNHSVTLSDNIASSGGSILFTGPVTMGHNISLSAGISGNITFSNTVAGNYNLTMSAGNAIAFNQNVGTINVLTVNSANTFTSSSITASSINVTGIITLATINGTLSTSGAAGITIAGTAISILGNVTTTGGGPLEITNTGLLTLSPNFNISLSGHFLQQDGSGSSVTGGGTLTTTGQSITFGSKLILTGDLSINSSGGAITLYDAEGGYALSLAAGSGDVIIDQVVGNDSALQNFTVSSAHDIWLSGIGSTVTGVTGTLSLTASHDINLYNAIYYANTQIYSAAGTINFTYGAQTNLTSSGPITFLGDIVLSGYNNLNVITNNGDFSFISLLGTTFENIVIDAGTGTAALNTIASSGTIDYFSVSAGKVTIAGDIDPINTNIVSLTDIMNIGSSHMISCVNTPYFNALGGNVGSLTSPIWVESQNTIFAGADGDPYSLADFIGTSASDNTVHPIPSNPPCIIIFNNTIIKDCRSPIPPTPPTPVVVIPAFASAGFESSYFNLSNDFYFLPDFIDKRYVYRDVPMYYTEAGNF